MSLQIVSANLAATLVLFLSSLNGAAPVIAADEGTAAKPSTAPVDAESVECFRSGGPLPEAQRRELIERIYGPEFAGLLEDVAAGRKNPAHVRFRWDDGEQRVVASWDPYRGDLEAGAGKAETAQLTELQRQHVLEQVYGREFLDVAEAVAAAHGRTDQVRFRWDPDQLRVVTSWSWRDRGAEIAEACDQVLRLFRDHVATLWGAK